MIDSSIPSAQFGPVTVYFGAKSGKYPDGNQVVVRGRDTTVAFDTPQVSNTIGPAFDSEIDLVVLGHVHEDHMAGLHRLPGKTVHVHERDVQAARSWEGLCEHYGYPETVMANLRKLIEVEFNYAPRPDAHSYSDGAVWDLGGGISVRAIHLPGHTAGHCALLVEPMGIAFIGDIELSGFGPYYGDATSSLSDFRRSLAVVAELPASVWITSHHKGVFTDRTSFESALAAYSRRLDEREQILIDRLSARPHSLDQLAQGRLLYPAGHKALWTDYAERRSISLHLQELIDLGRVEAPRLDALHGGLYRLV